MWVALRDASGRRRLSLPGPSASLPRAVVMQLLHIVGPPMLPWLGSPWRSLGVKVDCGCLGMPRMRGATRWSAGASSSVELWSLLWRLLASSVASRRAGSGGSDCTRRDGFAPAVSQRLNGDGLGCVLHAFGTEDIFKTWTRWLRSIENFRCVPLGGALGALPWCVSGGALGARVLGLPPAGVGPRVLCGHLMAGLLGVLHLVVAPCI